MVHAWSIYFEVCWWPGANIPPYRHDDAVYGNVITQKPIPYYRPFVRKIHWSPVDSLHNRPMKCAALMFLSFASISCWKSSQFTRDLRIVTLTWRPCNDRGYPKLIVHVLEHSMLMFQGEEEAFQQNRIQRTNHISFHHIFNATNHGVGIDKTLRVSMSILFTPAIDGYVLSIRDDVIKWKHFPRYWPFVRGIHRVNSRTMASDAKLWCFRWCASE